MNIWFVTTGSSDVQLKTNEYWDDWYRSIKPDCYQLPFKPMQTIPEAEEPYRIEPRVLGMAYQNFPEEVWENLEFPLLKEFSKYLKEESIDEIILLLTDQSQVFDTNDREDLKCPFWRDTQKLQPIFEHYFQIHFPKAKLVILKIAPKQGESGLDDWSFVLEIVRTQFKEIILDVDAPTSVYVSHQAGTPALSSAVQFCSLARFRTDVQFLVSNEYHPDQTQPIPRSTYLQGMQIQEAKALLKRHDYSGVRDLLEFTQSKPLEPKIKQIKYLLDAAENWNCAEFHKFKKIINDRNLLPNFSFPWWRVGYESAYLAWVRLQQGSSVDAMFHSFRAVEGITSLWAEKTYPDHVRRDPKKGLQLNRSICNQFNLASWFGISERPKEEIGAYGKALFSLLKEDRSQDWQLNSYIRIFCEPLARNYNGSDIFEERNNLFHRLEGLQEAELFEAWNVSDSELWIKRVLGCLNFISRKDYQFTFFEQKEASDNEASLMLIVHEKLTNAIANL